MKILFLFLLALSGAIVTIITPEVKLTLANVTETANVVEATAAPQTEEAPIIRAVPSETAPVYTAEPIPAGTDMDAIFGDPVIEDHFERGSTGFGINAGLNDDEAMRIIALNNRLSLQPKKNNGWITWRLRPPVITDGAAEMEFAITTCARGDRMGVIMRAGDYSSGHGYYYSLACEGVVSILRDSTVIASASVPELFKSESGDINVLTAVAAGNTLTAILNGETAVSVQDDTYSSGYAGFFTAPQQEQTLTLDISSFTEYTRN